MSVLIVTKEERAALEKKWAEMEKAGTLPGGVLLGIPIEATDGRFAYIDARWDTPDVKTGAPAVTARVADAVKDVAIGVTTLTKVVSVMPKDFVTKTVEVAVKVVER